MKITEKEFIEKVCNSTCMTPHGKNCHAFKKCSQRETLERFNIEIEQPKTKLDEANEIVLEEHYEYGVGDYYFKENVDKKISLLMEYIKELESKK